ncbi:histidine ammonia-lyase [Alkaliphilus metalliredigens QYMF]|uniref:Histidine ammonia-lyase n=1 Tax=Alkaliphilus metalliredigens (strain QYMF) TaxID=293826 RepID=HUTH_ALKMQ|nr:histidine ammonia-lyase [Alkaliphilus metalliredigens]A6TSX0.1 RecName: Full=Histidine ammonia-lyase; Short=Histidase [Alkaliphilus metalliredigens QYMF]ABR49288.1 histidine ammonia-lyase [Alkaliphilus metalliredigens QYMF]
MKKVSINGNDLTLEEMIMVAREYCSITIEPEAMVRVANTRKVVERYVEEERVVYGITTGFGKFSDVAISKDQTEMLQRNLIISHACGVGEPLKEEVVRGVLLLRANALAKGYSGVRPNTLETLINMLNKGVHPIIPEKGSLGSSGDLAPLAHMVLVMMGEGEATYKGNKMSGKEAMEKAGIPPVVLSAKEGLALINGTQVMTAIGALLIYDCQKLIKLADIAGALTLEAQRGIIDAFDHKVHRVRPHQGQQQTAQNIVNLVAGSTLITRQGEVRVQDAYTLRCIPQIHGASRDAIMYAVDKVNIEINGATDNPLIFPEEDEVISGGNFHGQPMALTFDFLGIAIAELANVSERRIERLVNPQLSGLPAFLTAKGGLNSGFMITQYAAASLVSENKILAHPASVDSIPSSANQEDHVSMGTIAARKARSIYENTVNVLGVELMAASQAVEFYDGYELGIGTRRAYDTIRKSVAHLDEDRVMYVDMNRCAELVFNHKIVDEVEKVVSIL